MELNANQVIPFDDGDVGIEIDDESDDEEIACVAIILFGVYFLLSQNYEENQVHRRQFRSICQVCSVLCA